MFLETAGNVCLVILLSLADAQSQNGWIVHYRLQSICIMTGNSVDIPCWYQNPGKQKVNRTFWYKEWMDRDIDPKDLAYDPEYRDRVEYLGDKNHNCAFRIKQLKREDSNEYRFRLITYWNERYTVKPGVTLSVTDTQVAAKQELEFALALTCNTGCPHGNVMYTWFKNGHQLQGEYLDNMYIHIHYKEDTKKYSCAFQDRKGSSLQESIYVIYTMIVNPLGEIVEGNSVILICRSNATESENNYKWYKKNGIHTHEMMSSKTLIIKDIKPEHSGHYFCGIWSVTSTEVYINVQYAPKNISVIAFPSENLKERDSVTLTCGAKANPEVERYTWFKKNGEEIIELGSWNSYTMTNITSKDSGPYYCSGENRHGTINSKFLSVNVQYAPKNISVIAFPSVNLKERDSVTLTCGAKANPEVERYTWFKKNGEEIIELGSGNSYTITSITSKDSGPYYCSGENRHGTINSKFLSVNVQYAPKNISVIAYPSVNLKERDSVTLTCGAKANPEVERYTWFKKNGEEIIELGTGKNYTITNITSKDSGPYYCSGENRHGTINSTYLSVNVQYAPREFSVSVSPSGGIMMGDSVTLTCNGDANPPAKSYQWFKDEFLISPEVSGQNYTINNITFEHNGRYNCNATNDIGSHSSPAVFIFVERETAAIIGTTVGIAAVVVLVVVMTLVWKISKHSQCKKDTTGEMQRKDTANPVYANISEMAPNVIEIQEEALYSTVQHDKSRDREQVQYMSISEPCDPNVDEVQYSTIQFPLSSVTSGTPVQMLTDASAIYSTVSKP
ncbi:B-cell receptor CD22-like isoform X2 [Paramormyrops kingsleyae]